jgi:TonB-linked SusC/RagA family outer membrane protein
MSLPNSASKRQLALCKGPTLLLSFLKTIAMKMSFIFLLALCIEVQARGIAQPISLSERNVSLEKLFKQIRKQSDYRFLYTREMLRGTSPVSISVRKMPLEDVLSRIFSAQPLEYTILDETIIVKPKTEALSLSTSIVNTVAVPPIVKGIVRDANGSPLSGATISIKGTNRSTQTNSRGEFSIEASEVKTVLVISYIGFETQEIVADDKVEMLIQLKTTASALSDVVVVGYGTQRKVNLTGAVDQITSEALENRPVPNLNQGLQGVLPNLNIRMLDGKPNQAPRFNIRGTTSIGQGGNALVLIDGVEGDPGLINPNDIATISILKDAASASIYGARGAFGVVLITTKNPAKGKTSITYTVNHSIKSPTTIPDFVNDGYTFAKMFAESSVAWDGQFPQAVNKTLKFSQAYLDELKRRQGLGLPEVDIDPVTGEYIYYASTDWYKLLYKDHNSADEHNLTISGGGDKTSFMITGRYYGQQGLFRYNSDDYKMLNFRAKGSVQVYPWLRIDNNTDVSNMKYHNPLNVGEGGGIWRNIADEGHPLAPLLNPDGTLTFSAAYTVGDLFYGKNGFDQERGIVRNRTGFTAEFFNNTFRLKGDVTYQITETGEKRKQVPVPYSIKPGVISYVGTTTNDIREIRQRTQYVATNIYGEYENTFKLNHYLKVLLGYNYEQSTFKSLTAQRNGLIFENANDISLALGSSVSTGGGFEEWAILGGFGRVNYSFKNRYLLEVNGRYDGSSKFPTNQRYGFFPSVSAGWRISNEAFWHVSPKFITDLKIRASYGSLGNGNVASYAYQEQFSISQSGLILNGTRPQQTSRPSVLPSGLTWETSTTKNLGLDLAMLSNRLRFVGDAYVRNTTDMFTVGVTLPAVFGATPPRGNYADLRTKGWEVSLSWGDHFNLTRKPFNYDVRVTLADNTAVITKYNNPTKLLTDYYEGMRIGEIWGYTTEGFFTSTDDIAKHANQKLFLSTSSGATYPGDIKLMDRNKDGIVNPGANTAIDPGDRWIIGNSAPRYMYGINLGGDWNNFFLSAFFQGVGKQDWFPSTEAGVFWGQYNRPYNKIPRWQLNNHWTADNPDALLPRYVSRLANRAGGILREAQTRYIFSVAYIRLKNIQFGYNLPRKIVQKIHSSNARVYISAENIWTYSPIFRITKDIDPENTGPSDQLFTTANAGDAYNYPILKGVTLGLSVSF